MEARRRPVLRIFISSTAVDLIDYREKVRDAVLRLENLPIAMETFSSLSGQPAQECMKMAAEADAVICIVAHRYGYVPPVELGGDGKRSITWLEVDAAKSAGKPVFAFLVDPKAPWTGVKEQDRLTSEPPAKVPEIVTAVQKLQEFKAYLERECTRSTFTNEEELAKLVAITLTHLEPQRSYTSTTRIWQPLFCHALQPAQHFRGREAKLQELKDWLQSPVTPDRVISIVAAGGTGKTALVHEALHQATLSDRAGVFVWSFYEDPHTDEFLRAAYLYFTGEKDAPAGGMLQRLQLALSGDKPHILVLDGLERVQSEGNHQRRGELEDFQLKRLIRAFAGGIGSARALVTSRFPLVDLDGYTGAGHRAIVLDDLERPVAFDVLRAWKVNGDEAALMRLLEPLNIGGSYHALSVAVLGSYLGNFANGDPARAPEFSLLDAQEADPKARRLHRILEHYAKALTSSERDLLARLSLFPRGVQVELLGWIVQSGGEMAGTLIGLSDHELVYLLERLKGLGLVFRYEAGRQAVYSAHPFLRDFFRNLLTTQPEFVHESVRAKLAPNLKARPKSYPSDPTILDQYEFLIEQTLLAGRVQEAFDLYWYGLGGYPNLGWRLGEHARGLRLLERFVPQDAFSNVEPYLSSRNRSSLINDLGTFAGNLGDLGRSRQAYKYCRRSAEKASDLFNESTANENLAIVELYSGHFPEALKLADSAFSLAVDAEFDHGEIVAIAYRATSHFMLGQVDDAAVDFRRATAPLGRPLPFLYGVLESECKLLAGNVSAARNQIHAGRRSAIEENLNDSLCRYNILLSRILVYDDPAQATALLAVVREFANDSGSVDLQLRCFNAAAELQLHLRNYSQAINEAEAGVVLADSCSHGWFAIKLNIVLAEILLATGNSHKALQTSRNALDRSDHADCQYAWGKADGLHFCGLAHLKLGERELAFQRLTAALELRERLGHGRVEETRRALASLRQAKGNSQEVSAKSASTTEGKF